MEVPLEPIWWFIFGTIIGSYLNVVVLRWVGKNHSRPCLDQEKELKTEEFTLSGRSLCPHCHRPLRWWELVPIMSFIFLRAHCARCAQPIFVQYPLVEFSFGLITMILGLRGDYVGIALAALLVVLFVIDLKTFLLPDIFVGLLLVSVMSQLLISNDHSLADSAFGVALGAGFLGFLWLITRGQGIGLGDVKLIAPLGLLFGTIGTFALLFLSFILGGIVGIALLAGGKARLKTAVPFGPFLAGVALLFLLLPELPRQLVSTFYGL